MADANSAPTMGAADASTGGGVGSGGIAVTLEQVRDQLAPYSCGSELVEKLVAGLRC